MRGRSTAPVLQVLGTAGAVVLLSAGATQAQTTLPGIVVTSPSPVVRSAPAAAAPTPAAASVPALQVPIPGLIVTDDIFVPLTIVTDREVLATPGSTITDTLQSRPGILGSTFAAGANRPIIRGLDNHRVRVQENGIGTHDVSALSEDHAVPVDPFAAKRVEVIRGPATLRYGSQAIGGVVAVENDRIPTAIPPRGVAAEVRGGLSSADNGRDGGFLVTAGAGSFAVHADAFRRRASDYDTPDGRQLNTFVESDGFSVGGSYIWRHGFLGVSFSRFESLYGIPGEEAATLRPRIDMIQEKAQAKGEWRVGDYGLEAVRMWLGATRYAHDEIIDEGLGDVVGTRFTNREVEGRLEAQHLPVMTGWGELRGALGVQAGRKKVAGLLPEDPGEGLLDPAARQRTIAGFLFEELQMTRQLRLQAAARIESNRAEGTGIGDLTVPTAPEAFSRTFTPLSGSLGVLYDLPLGVVARVTGQYTERAPDVAELYSKGPHEATETFEIGNPSLELEKAATVELGLKKAKGAFRFDGSVYHTRYDGFIFKNFTGVQCGESLASCGSETELDQVVYAQRDARFTGAELAAELDIAPIWRGVWGLDGQYDYVRATFDGDVNVPRIPPHRLGGGLYYRDPAWFARVSLLHAFDQDNVSAIDPKDTPTDGYTLLNAELSHTWKMARDGVLVPQMTIGLKGENLLDEDVRNHVSVKKDDVLQPGRTIRLFGSVKFN